MRATASSPLLHVHNLSRAFAGQPVVQGLGFTAHAGDIIGLMGPNGAGKSTTLKLLAGILQPGAGATITIAAAALLTQRTAAQRRLGYLPEQPDLYPSLTPAEYLHSLAALYSLPKPARTQRVAEVAELTSCAAFLHTPLGQLSKGQRQRAYLAGTLLHSPAVLLLDEPTDGLDPNQKHALRITLQSLSATRVIIVSTHLLEEAETLCNRLLVLNHGRLVADTTPAALAKTARGDLRNAFQQLTTPRPSTVRKK